MRERNNDSFSFVLCWRRLKKGEFSGLVWPPTENLTLQVSCCKCWHNRNARIVSQRPSFQQNKPQTWIVYALKSSTSWQPKSWNDHKLKVNCHNFPCVVLPGASDFCLAIYTNQNPLRNTLNFLSASGPVKWRNLHRQWENKEGNFQLQTTATWWGLFSSLSKPVEGIPSEKCAETTREMPNLFCAAFLQQKDGDIWFWIPLVFLIGWHCVCTELAHWQLASYGTLPDFLFASLCWSHSFLRLTNNDVTVISLWRHQNALTWPNLRSGAQSWWKLRKCRRNSLNLTPDKRVLTRNISQRQNPIYGGIKMH